MTTTTSLKSRILNAKNNAEINALLDEGNTHQYRFASNVTRNSWQVAAKKRKQ
jgi:hypothetical protein